ncbi:MAG: hypothetical protein QG608_3311 [Actinomycetota bacterium]|nr:hypothetical protein [Actinomycetota bacterium]
MPGDVTTGTPWLPKRLLVGRPLDSDQLGETLLPKRIALPVYCSDPLSSTAYATDEILLVLSLGGLGLLHLTWPVATAVVVLMLVVVTSYRQTCRAYPQGGGAYTVSRDNLGTNASLSAAAALMVDYVLTVAVSVASGVANLASALPGISPYAVEISLGFITVLTIMNLRGVRESGRAFAVPTYGFVLLILTMIAAGTARILGGGTVRAESAGYGIAPEHPHATGLLVLVLVLRAFASGCTALTGVEAVSNGVPTFRRPKSRNAATTLAVMGALAVSMFVGITALALAGHVHIAEEGRITGAPAGYEQRTVVAQVAGSVYGYGSVLFVLVVFFTAAVLVMAANTAFNGFPILASVLSADGYLPRQLSRRGDRLVFSNGIIVLAMLAGVLIVAFDASTTRLIQLYIVGVFVSFTLSQAGMVRHWTRRLCDPLRTADPGPMRRARAINAVGALLTCVVLLVVLVSKFMHGAWIVVIAMPVVFTLMKAVHRHYDRVVTDLTPAARGVPLPSRVHAVVLVSRLHTPTLQALAYARATRPQRLTALNVRTDAAETRQLMDDWERREIPVSLTVVDSPYRDITGPVLEYVRQFHEENPRDLVVVFVPEYVLTRWWQNLMHNQSALRLKARLLIDAGVMVTSVPCRLESVDRTPASEPAAGPAAEATAGATAGETTRVPQ